MDVTLILKVGGIGLIVAVVNFFLSKTGREDYANLVSLSGVIVIIVMLVTKLGELISVIEGVFNVA